MRNSRKNINRKEEKSLRSLHLNTMVSTKRETKEFQGHHNILQTIQGSPRIDSHEERLVLNPSTHSTQLKTLCNRLRRKTKVTKFTFCGQSVILGIISIIENTRIAIPKIKISMVLIVVPW
uniref:Uncharacterized protein n=1 Tax=Opuntia streptacantha TaxID=393608 RepID=A0A7C8ZTK6_OPUST